MRLASFFRTSAPALASFVIAAPEPPALRTDPLLVDDPATMIALEDGGLAFGRVVGPGRLAAIAAAVSRDVAELSKDYAPNDARRTFNPRWVTRGRFELVGVVNRIDRRRFDPAACGEMRLVYRLAIKNRKRPLARLPMTVNVRIPQPKPPGDADCRAVAADWQRGGDLARRIAALPPPAQIELDFQSFHAPGSRKDMDDTAGYVLRSFEVAGDSLRPGGLFNTPRPDVPKDVLRRWALDNLAAIDDGSAVLPAELLAERIVSVSPRGLARKENRPFSALAPEDLAGLPLAGLALARTPELLLRRLDEATCAGCHQTRGVAGFHLLGEERTDASFNALAVGHSPHLGADLGWRRADLASAARGERGAPRPFAGYPDGRAGADCGLVPGLAAWGCEPGLVCRDIHHADVGVCARPGDSDAGEPCEDVTLAPSTRAEGPIVTANEPDATCPAPVGVQREGRFCAPNWLGFTGGVCSERCATSGVRRGGAVCVPIPSSGYETDCFVGDEPVESCLPRHLVTAWAAACDGAHPCRDDYGCARVPGAPHGEGACVPPYFLFQTRVDGPRLDR